MNYTIYKHTSKTSNKSYIGVTYQQLGYYMSNSANTQGGK